ncbi:hypothetical protein Tco_0432248 [Tanacetum coccineum]
MANLEFCDKHNMVAFLQKSTGSEEFHQIVDFLADSHIRYALTANPTIYASLIKQFWQTATIETVNNGEQQLSVTVDVANNCYYEVSGEGPSSPGRTQHTSTLIETSPQLQNIPNTNRKTRTRTRRMGIRIPQSDVPSSVADEAIIKEMHNGLVRATTTASSLEAEQGSGDIPVQARPERISNSWRMNLQSPKLLQQKPLSPPTPHGLKKLEKQLKHKRRKTVIDSSEDEGLSLDAKDSPKQGMMIDEIDKDKNVTFVKSRELGKSHDTAEHMMESEHDDDDITLAETLLNIKRKCSKRLSGEKSSDEEYERDCEIRIRKLKQDFNEWGSEVRKKEQDYNEERYSDARRRMLSIPFVDEDDYIPLGDIIARYSTSKSIIPDLPIEEPDNSLSMGDEHLDTTPSIENLVPIPSEFEGMSDDTCDVPNCDNNRINVESDLVESLINRDTSIVHSSKINPILEEFAGELAHIASIPPGIVEADFDPNDDTSSDDDDFEDIEYVKLRRRRNDDKKRKNFTLKIFFKSETFILQEKLINVHKRPIEPDQEGLISIDNSNNTLLELPEFESFHFYPPFPRPPPEPPDVEICLYFEPDVPVIDNFNELNVTKGKGE